MPLHIFLGDEELLYFIVRVEVTEIQIWFEFKLVYNLQNGLEIYKGFPSFPNVYWAEFPVSAQPTSFRAQPDQPSKPAPVVQPAERRAPISRSSIRLDNAESDPIVG
jgi:hypothetical protein